MFVIFFFFFYPEQCEQDSNEIKEREEIVKEIEDYVIQLWPRAKLELFGSSCNGFGIQSSDIDMCLILDEKVIISIDMYMIIFADIIKKIV